MKKSFLALSVAALLLSVPALALDNSARSDAPLTPGGAAGVHQAQGIDVPLIVSVVGVAAVTAAIIFVVSNSNGSTSHTTGAKPSK